jgi:putative colanic acid biosynthesis UDP-glucose lipid carrier transferase
MRRIVDPLLTIVVLVIVTLATRTVFGGAQVMISIVTFFVASQVFEDSALFRSCARGERWRDLTSIMMSWSIVVGIILFVAFAAKISEDFSRIVMVIWFVTTPFVLYAAHRVARVWVRRMRLQGNLRTAVVVGATDLALRLTERIEQDPCLMIEVDGFFEDRETERLPENAVPRLLGTLDTLAAYVKTHNVNVVYITLPMNRLPRMHALMEALHDTTVSIYFVPDVFLFDLIQARIDNIAGVPVIGVRESPLIHINSFNKRVLDILLTLIILPLIAPLLLAVAIGVKLSSRGPVIFRQRRYGLEGEEIHVYKFRSMTVREDGADVRQATRNDVRITRFGAFIRKTSIDELPQFFNVLQGRMSIVGPRPHAVAHNELYRNLISGYMIRHKVRPGITGWAQVNGLRGETDVVEKMEQRVQYDLAYLRNWSISFDLRIILRTVSVLIKGDNAY